MRERRSMERGNHMISFCLNNNTLHILLSLGREESIDSHAAAPHPLVIILQHHIRRKKCTPTSNSLSIRNFIYLPWNASVHPNMYRWWELRHTGTQRDRSVVAPHHTTAAEKERPFSSSRPSERTRRAKAHSLRVSWYRFRDINQSAVIPCSLVCRWISSVAELTALGLKGLI